MVYFEHYKTSSKECSIALCTLQTHSYNTFFRNFMLNRFRKQFCYNNVIWCTKEADLLIELLQYTDLFDTGQNDIWYGVLNLTK